VEPKAHLLTFKINLLILMLLVSFLGIAKPVLYNGGSQIAKYVEKRITMAMVSDKEIETVMENILYDEVKIKTKVPLTSASKVEIERIIDYVFMFDQVLTCLLVFSIVLLFFSIVSVNIKCCILLITVLWLLCNATAIMLNGGKAFSDLTVLAHATRWGLPIILFWNIRAASKISNEQDIIGVNFIVACCSVTFIIHGWEAINLNPFFQDLLYNLFNPIGFSMPASVNVMILKCIGTMDILLAVVILFLRRPKIFLWMSFWGLLTALSRPVTLGFDAWPEAAMRAGNFCMPCILYFTYKSRKISQTFIGN
jgi:hypothetical protein